jgi:hypothetical protein
VDAGAQFLVSPGLIGSVADAAREASVPYLPGVLTPSEIAAALSMGLDTVKLFPAQPLGPAYPRPAHSQTSQSGATTKTSSPGCRACKPLCVQAHARHPTSGITHATAT